MIKKDLLSLLREFVDRNFNVVDIQWDRRMSPRLLLNPYSEHYEERKMVAHYFLLVSSILEDKVVSISENARKLLIHLHKVFKKIFSKYPKLSCSRRILENADCTTG